MRTKNGCAVDELATYRLVNGGTVKGIVTGIIKDGDSKRVTMRVTSPTRHGYTRGETICIRDTAFLERRPA